MSLCLMTGAITGMKCTHIHEVADPNGWLQNYLCVPTDAPYQFEWSPSGSKSGKDCLLWDEPNDTHTWHDNYLCA